MTSETYYTIEPDNTREGFWVVEHGIYPENSVLAGQDRRVLLKHYDAIEEAVQDYPQAEVLEWSTRDIWTRPDLPISPPSWFDPLDAGEAWGEDNY